MTRPTPPPRRKMQPREWELHFSDVSGYGHYNAFVLQVGEKCERDCLIVRVREIPRPRKKEKR